MKAPDIVIQFAESVDCKGVRLVVAGHPVFGDVYEIFPDDGIEPPTPTGLPLLVSFVDNACAPIEPEEAFKLLAGE